MQIDNYGIILDNIYICCNLIQYLHAIMISLKYNKDKGMAKQVNRPSNCWIFGLTIGEHPKGAELLGMLIKDEYKTAEYSEIEL